MGHTLGVEPQKFSSNSDVNHMGFTMEILVEISSQNHEFSKSIKSPIDFPVKYVHSFSAPSILYALRPQQMTYQNDGDHAMEMMAPSIFIINVSELYCSTYSIATDIPEKRGFVGGGLCCSCC